MEVKEQFLARIDNSRFLVNFDGRNVAATDTPSNAAHLSYASADEWCQRLRKRGYPQAIVTDIAGNPMTYEAIKIALAAAAPEQSQAPPPATIEELDVMPAGDYRRRYRSEPSFRESADQLEAQPRKVVKRRWYLSGGSNAVSISLFMV